MIKLVLFKDLEYMVIYQIKNIQKLKKRKKKKKIKNLVLNLKEEDLLKH